MVLTHNLALCCAKRRTSMHFLTEFVFLYKECATQLVGKTGIRASEKRANPQVRKMP